MSRLRYNNLIAYLDGDHDASTTTFEFTTALQEGGVNIPSVVSPDILVMTCGTEIVHVTAYTSGALTATVDREQEESAAAAHVSGSRIYNTPTKNDPEIAGISQTFLDNSIGIPFNGDAGVLVKNPPGEVYVGFEVLSGPTALDDTYGIGLFEAADSGYAVVEAYSENSAGHNANGAIVALANDATGDGNRGAKVYVSQWQDPESGYFDIEAAASKTVATGSYSDGTVTASVRMDASADLGIGATPAARLIMSLSGAGDAMEIERNADGVHINTLGVDLAFNGETPVPRPTITGSISTDLAAIVTDLLAALDSLGLITDSTTA